MRPPGAILAPGETIIATGNYSSSYPIRELGIVGCACVVTIFFFLFC